MRSGFIVSTIVKSLTSVASTFIIIIIAIPISNIFLYCTLGYIVEDIVSKPVLLIKITFFSSTRTYANILLRFFLISFYKTCFLIKSTDVFSIRRIGTTCWSEVFGHCFQIIVIIRKQCSNLFRHEVAIIVTEISVNEFVILTFHRVIAGVEIVVQRCFRIGTIKH